MIAPHDLRISCHREPWCMDAIAIRFSVPEQKGRIAIGQPLVFKSIEGYELYRETEPSIRITPETAQQFMDELWRSGIRPTNGAGSTGQLAAIKDHLTDLQKIVKHTLKLKD